MRGLRVVRPVVALGAAASALLLSACDPTDLPPRGCIDAPGSANDVSRPDLCDASGASTAIVKWDGTNPVDYAWPGEWDGRGMPGTLDGVTPARGAVTSDDATAELTLTRGANGGVVAATGSSVIGTADMSSIISLAAQGGSTIRAVVAGGSTLVAGASEGGEITARVEDRSQGWLDAYGGSIDALLLGGSTGRVTTGWGSATVEARGGSNVDVSSSQGADTTVYADGGSTVSASGDQVAVSDIRATEGSSVDIYTSNPGVEDSGDVTALVDASGASSVVANLFKSTADITATNGASVTAKGDYYGRIYANVDEAVANVTASGPDSIATVDATGAGSTADATAYNSGQLTVDVSDSGTVNSVATGASNVSATAAGTGSTVDQNVTSQYNTRTGDGAPVVIPVVVAVARDGGAVSQQFSATDGSVVSATAEGEGSLAEVTGYQVVGVITVYAAEGGHAFVYTKEDDTVEFGCVGGVTSVTTDAGSCTSDGDTATYSYPDGREVVVAKASDGTSTSTTRTATTTAVSSTSSTTGSTTTTSESAEPTATTVAPVAETSTSSTVPESTTTTTPAATTTTTQTTTSAPTTTTESTTAQTTAPVATTTTVTSTPVTTTPVAEPVSN